MKDFFISYNKADKQWAKWIAGCLEKNGYTTIIQAWDFRPGNNFAIEMQSAINNSERIVLVLSKSYLSSDYCLSEWAAMFTKDPIGEKRGIIPVRIDDVEPTGLFSGLIYVDLFTVHNAIKAEKKILDAVDEKEIPRKQAQYPNETEGKVRQRITNIEEDEFYFLRLGIGDDTAKDALVNKYTGLVPHIAKKYDSLNYSVEKSDLIQVGMEGLLKAISVFSIDKSVSFSSFACRIIENEIMLYIKHNLNKKVDLSQIESLDIEEIEDVLILDSVSFDPIGDHVDEMEKVERRKILKQVMEEVLDEREKQIIQFRFGFMGKPQSQKEVAETFNISRSYISRIEKRALLKMQKYIDKHGLL